MLHVYKKVSDWLDFMLHWLSLFVTLIPVRLRTKVGRKNIFRRCNFFLEFWNKVWHEDTDFVGGYLFPAWGLSPPPCRRPWSEIHWCCYISQNTHFFKNILKCLLNLVVPELIVGVPCQEKASFAFCMFDILFYAWKKYQTSKSVND